MDNQNEKKAFITNADLQLELKALRSDVRLWVLGAVALNQFLSGVDIPSGVAGVAVFGVLFKGVIMAAFRGGG